MATSPASCPIPPPPAPPTTRPAGCCTVRDVERVALMVCMTCPHARAARFHFCTLNGQELARRACDRSGIMAPASRSCPLGLGPDARGRVRWLDETWYGVPWPRRLLLVWPVRIWWGTPRLTRVLEGCGCPRPPRVIWEAWWRSARRLLRPMPPRGG